MALTFVNGNILTASQLNTNIVQSHGVNGVNVVSGFTGITFTTVAAQTVSVTYGMTFSVLMGCTFCMQSASSIDLVVTSSGTILTSGFTARVATRNGGTVSGFFSVHWMAWGT